MNTRNKLALLALAVSIPLILGVLTTSGLAGYSPLEDKAADTPGRAQLESSPIAGAAVLTDGQSKYPLGLYLDILEDPTKALTIGEVSSAAYASKFIPSQVEVPNYGYTESAYWVRLRFDNQTKQTMEWLLEDGYANTQYADLYLPSTNGNGFEVRQTGSLRPVSTRDIPYPNIIFSLNIPPQSQPIFYLRFQSGASMTLPLTLWTKDAFIVNSAHSMMLHWLLFGGFLALLVYHLFLLFTVRELIYVYFAIMIASMLAMLLEYTGYLSVYILPSLYNLKPYYIPVIISVMYISIIIFSDAFLELNSRIPELHWANLFMVAVWAGILILTPFVSYLEIARLATPWMLVTIGLTWVIGIAAWKKGAPPTRFFMFAWLGMAASLFLWVLVRLAFIPSTAFTENLFEVGFIVMAVSWSIALADRINLLKAETERANQSIQQSQHELVQILDGVPLGIVVYGLDQTPRYVNQRAIDILSNPDRGIQPTVQAQRTLAEALDYFSFHISGTKEKYPLDKLPIYSALKGQFASVDDVEADLVDRTIPIEIWASPVTDNDGNVQSAVAAFQDITRRRQVEKELSEYRKSLETLVDLRTEELNEINETLNLRLAWSSVVNEVQPKITGEAGMARLYETLSDKIVGLLNANLVFILSSELHRDPPIMLYSTAKGECLDDTDIISACFQKNSQLRRDISAGKTLIWSAGEPGVIPEPSEQWLQEQDVRALILAPMIIGQSSFGVLGVGLPTDKKPDSVLVDIVMGMAFDLGRLADDAILLDQKLALVALEERNRLARDLHDSVTQVLFTATLLTEVMPQIWKRDPDQGMQTLEKLRLLTRGALAEMRTMLIELRPASVINTPLSELLAQLTEAVTCRSGLPFKLFIEQIPLLPEDTQMNFYRIAQEALNNVVKHAQALHVAVTLSETELPANGDGDTSREVKLLIEDDGVGFYTEGDKPGHLGIGIMRERAAAIKADFSIESKLGHGTSVSLVWSDGNKAGS